MHFDITLGPDYNSGLPIKVYWKPLVPDLYEITDYTLTGDLLQFDYDFTPWGFEPGFQLQIVVFQNDLIIHIHDFVIV